MNLGNLRKSLQEKYFSFLEYVNNSFDVFKSFVKKYPLIVFLHFLVSTILGLFISFVLWTPLRKMYEAAFEYNKIQNKLTTDKFILAMLTVVICLLGYIAISGFIEFIIVIIRKKIGLEIEEKIDEFKVLEIIVKYLIMVFINILVWTLLLIIAIIFSIVASPLVLIVMVLLILKINLLYFKQAYYLREVNIIEAFKYNLHLSKGKRLLIIIPLVIIILITLLLNQFFGWTLEIMIKNPQLLVVVISIIAGIIKTISEIFVVTLENVVYLNLEYMDLKELKSEII